MLCLDSAVAGSHVGLDDFVEMTKKYAQGIAPSPVMAAAGGDDDDNDNDVVVKNPDELPLHQKVGSSQDLSLCLGSCCQYEPTVWFLGLLKFTVCKFMNCGDWKDEMWYFILNFSICLD